LFAERYPGIKIYGGADEGVDACTDPLQDEETIKMENGVTIKALKSPCHTTVFSNTL
jgi:hypothetical protein